MSDALSQIEDLAVDRAAVGVTDAQETLGEHGPVDEVFELASVTKLLTATAALVAIQDGLVHLDEPAGPEGATIRHLLAHASGLPFQPGGPTTGVGRRRIYSNVGFERLAEVVADRAGLPFAEHLALEVLEPLGMTDTSLEGSPAAGGRGTVSDLLRFARELLAPTLVDPDLYAEATTPVFPDLGGILPGYGRQDPNPWGLGFEIRDGKDPHWTGSGNSPATFGHFGQSGSFLWVDPEARVAATFLGSDAFGQWAIDAWPRLSDDILAGFGKGT